MSTDTVKLKTRWGVFYRGSLATSSLTERGAYADAGKLILQRAWDSKEVQVKQYTKEVRS